MKSFWNKNLSYLDNYKALKSELEKDTRDWIVDQEPPKDGTQVYFLCSNDSQDKYQYDVGYWADYTIAWWYDVNAGSIKGEWDTEFGNCEQILGWKLVI